MKKILLFLLVIVSFQAFSQTPTGYQHRRVNERIQGKFMVDSVFTLPRYTDTVQANLHKLTVDTCGAMFFSYTKDSVYYRACNPKRWVVVGTGDDVDSVTFSPSQNVDSVFYWIGGTSYLAGVVDVRCGLISPGIVVHDSLMAVTVSPSIHRSCEDGIRYTTELTTLQLSAADATLNRYDVIALEGDDVIVVEGDESATPSKPQLSSGQTELTFFYIPALATVPTPGGGGVIDTLLVYDQNVEFTVSASSTTADADNFASPYHFTKAVSVGAIGLLSNVSFTSTATYSKANYNSLRFFVKLKSAFASTCRLVIYFRNNGVTTSSGIVLANGTYGFSRTNASTYQEIIIPLSDFGFTSNDFDAIMFQSSGVNANGFYLDWIMLTGGINQSVTHPNSFGFVQTTSGNAISTQPNDLITFVGAGGITTSATGKTVTIDGSALTPTLTSTRVGYGAVGNTLTGTSNFTFDNSTKTLTLNDAAANSFIDVYSNGGTFNTRIAPTFVNTYYVRYSEMGTQATPASGFGLIYFKSDGHAYALNDAGTETDLQGAGATPTLQQVLDAGSTLTSSETIATGAFSLTVSTSTGSTTPLLATSTSGPAFSTQATSGAGLTSYSASGLGIQASSDGGTYGGQFQTYSAGSNNSVLPVMNLRALNGGAPSVAGFGAKIDFELMTTDFGTTFTSNGLFSKLHNPTHATRTSQFGVIGVSNAVSDTMATMGGYVNLTESSATQITTTTIGSGKIQGGQILLTIEANDATDYQVRTMRFIWGAVNKAGTLSININTPEETGVTSSGTLTATITGVDNGSGVLSFKVNAVSSLTQSTLRCSYQTFKNF